MCGRLLFVSLLSVFLFALSGCSNKRTTIKKNHDNSVANLTITSTVSAKDELTYEKEKQTTTVKTSISKQDNEKQTSNNFVTTKNKNVHSSTSKSSKVKPSLSSTTKEISIIGDSEKAEIMTTTISKKEELSTEADIEITKYEHGIVLPDDEW